MLRPTPPDTVTPRRQRDRVLIDNVAHIRVSSTDTLDDIGYGTGLPIVYPAGEGWATTHVGNVRFCAWYRSPK